MSQYKDYTGSAVQASSACTYGNLSNYNSNVSRSACSNRYVVVPSFGGAPGYNSISNVSVYNAGPCTFKNAYSNCNCSNYIAKLCQ